MLPDGAPQASLAPSFRRQEFRFARDGVWYTMEQLQKHYNTDLVYFWNEAAGASPPGSSQRAGRRAAEQDEADIVRIAAEPVPAWTQCMAR